MGRADGIFKIKMTENAFVPIEISSGALSAKIIPYGASLCDLRLSKVDRPLILGFGNPHDYVRHRDHYFGAIIGRYAGRIAGGRCTVEGKPLCLDINAPPNHLHGGKNALAHLPWSLEKHTAQTVILTLESPDGDNGYPGHISVRAIYEIIEPKTLRLTITAKTDKATPLNFAHHPYFNLDGRRDCRAHELTIAADDYLPADAQKLPTGDIIQVAGTEYDFRTAKKLSVAPPLDNTFCLNRHHALKFAARLSTQNGISMEVWTTQMGLHIYDAEQIKGDLLGLRGRHYALHAGIAMEAQNWPDAPNNLDFPNTIYDPTSPYMQVTEYRFK